MTMKLTILAIFSLLFFSSCGDTNQINRGYVISKSQVEKEEIPPSEPESNFESDFEEEE